MLALLLAAAVPQTAVDAERAFAADAQALGQWTAFRKWAMADAVMFTPQPVNAQAFLKPLKDPPRAVRWSPTASYLSCDGKVAANTGEWRRADGSVGYFSTVWVRQADGGWKWVVDGGDALTTPRPRTDRPKLRRASCKGRPLRWGAPLADTGRTGTGDSPDKTLGWRWIVELDGSRQFYVSLWNSRRAFAVIKDEITVSTPPLMSPPAPKP